MSIKVKLKTYGPAFIRCDGAGELSFGNEESNIRSQSPPLCSPAELLLYATGACIAKSILVAAKPKKVSVQPFTVVVSGESATDLPIRVGTVNIAVDGSFAEDLEQAASVLKAAKAICTVSNTLNAQMHLSLR
ncbi:MAG: OsmC family protein [Oceanospirillaceae bacterium]